jgi:flavin reductase (DIM6/NTAB) family NADH-FMN oxidoreductase RutF
MRKLLNIVLFGNTFFKEFPAISIDENAIKEKVFFEADGKKIDVSRKHWLLSLEPMIYGIWLESESNLNKETNCSLYFNCEQGKEVAVVDLKFTESINEKDGTLALFEVQNSSISYLNPIKAKLIYGVYYKRPKLSFSQFQNLVAAFSYPRKVRLISFKKDGYFNIFPMDLVGNIPGTDYFVLGLRHSNSTLDKIIEQKKIVAAEFPASLKNAVYQLAKHHSKNPLSMDSIPFEVKETELYKFPIPETATKYFEINIVRTMNLGSHMLLLGQAMNTVEMNGQANSLHHIHFLNYIHQKKNNEGHKLV